MPPTDEAFVLEFLNVALREKWSLDRFRGELLERPASQQNVLVAVMFDMLLAAQRHRDPRLN